MVPTFHRADFSRLRRVIVAAALLAAAPLAMQAQKPQKPKLPRPRVLGRGMKLERDPATGELLARTAPEAAAGEAVRSPAIRTRVALVEVGCTVTAPDGMQLRGLSRDAFRLWEDGGEQTIASFDAATQPASLVLVVDASPSIFRELTAMREAAQSLSRSLQPEDEVAVVAFADQAELLLPFSRDRDLLAAALDSQELARVADSSESYIYQTVFIAARELLAGREGRKAIVLLTDGQDSGLGLTWDPASMNPRANDENALAFEDIAREMAADGIAFYAISTENRPRAMTEAWFAGHQRELMITPAARALGIPQYTLYLAELVRQVGGGFYFLRELGGLAEVYRRIALTLGAEYTLGYYPSSGTASPGWRSLRVELRSGAPVPAGTQVTHRAAYYVPALP